MTVTVVKNVDNQTINIHYTVAPEDAVYGNLMIAAVREAKTRLNRAILATSKALVLVGDSPTELNDTCVDLLQSYFCLPPPAPATRADYRATLMRIMECLRKVSPGLGKNGLTIQKIEQQHLNQGYQGFVKVGLLERALKFQGGDDAHAFAPVAELDSDIYLRYQLLTSNYEAAINTLIHECTHKFAHTVDHCYFANWGLKGQRETYWHAIAMAKTLIAYNVNYWMATAPPQQTRADASAAILAGVAATKNMVATSLAVGLEFKRLMLDIDAEVKTRMANYLDTPSYRDLTNVKALNNADSFSNYVISVPDSVARFEQARRA